MSNPNRQFSRRQFINGSEPSQIMQSVAKAVQCAIPKSWAFCLLAFPLDSREGGLRYVSSGSRESVLRLLKEFVQKEEAKQVPPVSGAAETL